MSSNLLVTLPKTQDHFNQTSTLALASPLAVPQQPQYPELAAAPGYQKEVITKEVVDVMFQQLLRGDVEEKLAVLEKLQEGEYFIYRDDQGRSRVFDFSQRLINLLWTLRQDKNQKVAFAARNLCEQGLLRIFQNSQGKYYAKTTDELSDLYLPQGEFLFEETDYPSLPKIDPFSINSLFSIRLEKAFLEPSTAEITWHFLRNKAKKQQKEKDDTDDNDSGKTLHGFALPLLLTIPFLQDGFIAQTFISTPTGIVLTALLFLSAVVMVGAFLKKKVTAWIERKISCLGKKNRRRNPSDHHCAV